MEKRKRDENRLGRDRNTLHINALIQRNLQMIISIVMIIIMILIMMLMIIMIMITFI